jgi:hypothetical protein
MLHYSCAGFGVQHQEIADTFVLQQQQRKWGGIGGVWGCGVHLLLLWSEVCGKGEERQTTEGQQRYTGSPVCLLQAQRGDERVLHYSHAQGRLGVTISLPLWWLKDCNELYHHRKCAARQLVCNVKSESVDPGCKWKLAIFWGLD